MKGRGAASDSGARARVLVVDDDERNLLALAEVLEPIADVVCSASGRDALRQLLRGEFAVILLDVFMPDLDGYETAALIRNRKQTSRIPIIFLSAVNKETEHLMRGYEMGAVDYVFKPVDALVLKSKVSVFVDLFDMRRKLEESERRQATILRALPMAIYEAFDGEDPRVLQRQFVGGDLVHFLGDEVETVLSGERNWQDWIHPEDRARLDREALDSGESVTMEYRWISPDGSKRHVLDQRVKTGAKGAGQRWAGTLLDITERKALEAQLVHVGKLDALGQLTGGVAHDFNNLLAAIIGGIGILQRRVEMGEKEQQIVDHMRHAAEQGTELVRRMMAFARQQDLTPASVDPIDLCEAVAGLVNHTLGGVTKVTWNSTVRDLNLFVDRSQMELALMNLILNARDAMPNGGEIKVLIEPYETSDRPMLRIRVEDSGCGIPDEVLAKVTDPFFTTKETGKGTGLGLSMVSGFVHQSGGQIRIESVVGEGTVIDLILPATQAKPQRQLNRGVNHLAWLANKRLMLIDDDPAVRLVLSEQFREAGGIVEHFASGREAIEAVRGAPTRYDFILSDFAMPELDGLETLQRISDIAPRVRAALMTGNADDARLRMAPVPVIRKPIDLMAVTSAFEAQCDRVVASTL